IKSFPPSFSLLNNLCERGGAAFAAGAMQPLPHAVNMPSGAPVPFYPYVRGSVIPPPRDYVVWSLFNFTAFNCCCVGFAALIFSIKSRDCKVIGDPEGAASYGRTARFLNIAALLLGIISFPSFLVFQTQLYNPKPTHNHFVSL
uniref:Uncharacterized protein n=1 Tax=Varanus komodoensis TaxID=61221 RepID=A0A8D2IJ41_VARKO